MTLCPGRGSGIPDHEAEHVSARLEVPWPGKPGNVRVQVVHRCNQYGCPKYCDEWTEEATYSEQVLRKVLEPRGMLLPEGCLLDCASVWNDVGSVNVQHRDDCPRSPAPAPERVPERFHLMQSRMQRTDRDPAGDIRPYG